MAKKVQTSNFNAKNIAVLAVFAAIGIALKIVVQPLKIATGAIGIPGGAIMGGLYMMWLVLGVAITRISCAGTIISAVQAVLAFATGLSVSFGWMSVVIYLASGLLSDIIMLIFRNHYNALVFVVACALANMIGTYIANLTLFSIPLIPLLIMVVGALVSGGVGGLLAYAVYNKVGKKYVTNITANQSVDINEDK